MQDDKVYTQEVIPDTPFPGQAVVSSSATQASSNQIYSPTTIQDQGFPIEKVATELLSDALNTRTKKILNSFQFTPSGAIQIGVYTQGLNGDIRISPAGITARDSVGNTTFDLDGESGDAVFSGTIQGKSLVSGQVLVGNGDIQIDGDNRRMVFFDSTGIPSIVIGQV